jgi:hypothetical protein
MTEKQGNLGRSCKKKRERETGKGENLEECLGRVIERKVEKF